MWTSIHRYYREVTTAPPARNFSFFSATQHKSFMLTTAVVFLAVSLVGSMARTEGDRELQAGTVR